MLELFLSPLYFFLNAPFNLEKIEDLPPLPENDEEKANEAETDEQTEAYDGMVERMEAELGYKTTVIATGGIARFVTPMCKTPIIYDKDLLVKGLAVLYRENKR